MRWTLRRRPRGKHAKGAVPLAVPRPALPLSLPLPGTGRAKLGAAVTGLPSAPLNAATLPVAVAPVVDAACAPPPAPPAAPAPAPAPAQAPPSAVPTQTAPVVVPPSPPAEPAHAAPERVGPHVELGFRDGSHAALDPDCEQALALAELAAVLTGP